MTRSETVKKAKDIISARRTEAVHTFESHIAEVSDVVPRIAEIDRLLSKTGARIVGNALNIENAGVEVIRADYEDLVREKRSLLVSAGYPEDYCDIKYTCEKCADSGFVGIKICDCLKKEIVKASLESSGLYYLTETQNFSTFSLSYYEGKAREIMEQNISILRSFVESFNRENDKSFLFMGGTGLGKTHLSTSVAVSLIEKGAYVVYESSIKLFSDFEARQFGRSPFGDDTDTEKYLDCDLLIIDDLGCEMTNSYTVSCLYNIINSRMIRHRSTIISTNLTQAELRKRYTDRIVSRIFGEFRPILFSGKDIREQKLR